jgi:beta-galactosidase
MFRFGVDYYPEHWPEARWAQDARDMRAAGFNTVRLAELAWSRLEPRPNAYNFAWLDRAIDVLHAAGIEVVLGTPTASPPPWVMQLFPDAFLVMKDGRAKTYGNRREYCPTHPGYRERSRSITQAMADHYAHHPAVIGWQTDNEFGDRCYCPNCRRFFQGWLQHHYPSLEALNAAWGTIFWSHVYTDWSQLPAPLASAGHDANGSPNPGLGLDYLRFMSDAYVAFQDEQIQILRRTCPGHFITHNLMGFNYDNLNYFDLARDLDFVTWDNYRRMQWTFTPQVQPVDAALAHATMRGLKDQNFWVMEQQAGPGGWEIVSMAPRPGELRLWAYQAIAHGADGIVFFRWRTARFGTEEYWHGLLDHDGTLSRRYYEIKGMGGEIGQIGDRIAGSRVDAQVAMLLDYDTRFAFQIQANNPQFTYSGHFRAIYSAFHKRNIAVDVVPPDAGLGKYKLVVVPAYYVLPEDVAERIVDFVQEGGTILVTPRTGVKDVTNTVVEMPLPGLLAEVCGVRVEEYDSLPAGLTQPLAFHLPALQGNAPQVQAWVDVLAPTTAEVVATYSADYYAGKPAITINRSGQGAAVYVGTFGDAGLYDTLAPWLLAEAGVQPGVETPNGVEMCVRGAAGRRILFVLNHTAVAQEVTLPDEYAHFGDGRAAVKTALQVAPRDVVVLMEA